jgi:PAS domain S-box-containing protein
MAANPDSRAGGSILIIQVPVEAAAYVLIAFIACMLGGHAWKRRTVPGGRYFVLIMITVSFWALLCAVEQVVSNANAIIMIARLEYVAVTLAGPLWLLFVLDYGYRSRWPITGNVKWLFVVPVITILLALTNDWHGLIWYRSSTDLTVLGYSIGLWVNLLYTYILIFAGFGLLLLAAVRSYKKNFMGTAALLLGTMIPVATSMLYMAGFDYGGIQDITPFALGVTVMLYTWGVFGHRLFDVVPAAREVLVKSMADGMLVLDQDGLIADMNPVAMRMFGVTPAAIGQPAATVLARWPGLVESWRSGANEQTELRIDSLEGPVWVDVRVSALHDSRGYACGRVIALRNVTNRKLAEEELKHFNESLQAEVNERKRAEASLEASLKEKELLLKEIHHRVKNNLQIISSLLSLQIVSTGNEIASVSLKESQNRIRSMALIHEKLYQSSDLAVIDFREYVQSLVISLTRSYVLNHALKIDVDIEAVSLDIDMAIPCGLIINELISNSLKYAFPGGQAGEIHISLHRNGGQYCLAVSDNGVGLPPDLDFRNTASLGLQLVTTLAGQLNGTVDCPPGKGTTFVITFLMKAADD